MPEHAAQKMDTRTYSTRTSVGSQPSHSAMPPHTPAIILFPDFRSRLWGSGIRGLRPYSSAGGGAEASRSEGSDSGEMIPAAFAALAAAFSAFRAWRAARFSVAFSARRFAFWFLRNDGLPLPAITLSPELWSGCKSSDPQSHPGTGS